MRPILVTATLALPAALLAATPAMAAGPQCPPTLAVNAQPEAPGGWSPYPGRDSHPLAGVALVSGDRAAQMASSAPATLAPDREMKRARALLQVWEFHGARREALFLLCRYRGTAATLAADLPETVRRCTLSLVTDLRGTVMEEQPTPPQLDCR